MKTIVEIKFDAGRILGGADAILGPSQCGNDVAKRKEYTIDNYFEKRSGTDVELTLEDTDERVSKVLALLAAHGKEPSVDRFDIYTEEELQAAPLLVFGVWGDKRLLAATTYDMSKACPRCNMGRRQTSPLIIDRGDLTKVEKRRVTATTDGDVLVHDVDVEPLLAAHVTGALFWPVYDETKAGNLEELRRQQLFIEHVMPPMSPKTLLDRTQVCPDCKRGCFTQVLGHSLRIVYRREDLANIQDVNLTWEWFGDGPSSAEDAVFKHAWPNPLVLVTPKVMNLLRGKTKKEAKYQGCVFKPIWIEDEKHEHPYPQT